MSLLPDPPDQDDLELTAEECAHLAQSARCEVCGHLDVFHDHEWCVCDIDGCHCENGRLQPPESRGPLTGVATVIQPSAAEILYLGAKPAGGGR